MVFILSEISLRHCFFKLDIARDILLSFINKSTTLTAVRGVNLRSNYIMLATARTAQGLNKALLYVIRACMRVLLHKDDKRDLGPLAL